jgi:putative spermidine/putrescine transport system permease protein
MAKLINYLMLLPGLITCLIFLIGPLSTMVLMSFYTASGHIAYESKLTLENYVRFFTSPQTPIILYNTFAMAILTCIVIFVFAYPLAHFLTFTIKSEKLRTYIISLLLVPFLIDWTIRSVTWIPILGDEGIVNYILMSIGAIREPVGMLFSRNALILIWFQTYFVFMMFPIQLALQRIDPDLVHAAMVSKAPPHRVQYDIVFKLSLPGIICGFIFVFVSVIGDHITPGLWAGGMQVLGLSISTYASNFVWPYAAALATVMLIIALLILYILLKIVDIKKLIYE